MELFRKCRKVLRKRYFFLIFAFIRNITYVQTLDQADIVQIQS